MKILEDFAKNGFHYSIISRKNNIAIAKACTKEGGGVAYDVIVIRERGETMLFNNLMPAAEYGPSNEEFGSFGWSYPNAEMAERKMKDLVESGRFNKKEKI